VDERREFLIHLRVHVGGRCLVQNEVDAHAAQFKEEQENEYLIAGDIFKFTLFMDYSPERWIAVSVADNPVLGPSIVAVNSVLKSRPCRPDLSIAL
jgi:hypothetical protein